MKTNVSGILENMMQARANVKAESAGDAKEQKLAVSFFEMMSQNTAASNNASASNSDELVYRVESQESSATQNAYDANANPVNSVSVKEAVPPEEMALEASELLEDCEEEIRKVLKEQFGVTDEEIDQVLSSLGIGILDLANIQDLAAFVQELTGQDIGALFLSEAFRTAKSFIVETADTLCAELGITKEEWELLAKAYESQKQAKGTESQLPMGELMTGTEEETAQAGEALPVQTEQPISEDISKDIPADQKKEQEAVSVTVQRKEEPQTEQISESKEADEPAEKADSVLQKNGSAEPKTADGKQNFDSGEAKQELPQQEKNAAPDLTGAHAHTVAPEGQTLKAEPFTVPQEAPVPYASQVDTMEIIEQIARQVRITVSAEATSMEMQLNPEHLGKIYLNITEKEGAVRAQIAAQNQTVKEALETQVAQLRQSLSQQGVKVDAIEVTVASHEFEQNLEENARQEEQTREQMQQSGKQARRGLNLNELDELSGMMTEEERLVAQIMRDNGNQVDLTA